MKFYLTRDSSRRSQNLESAIAEVDFKSLGDLLEFIDNEGVNVTISPKDNDGKCWIHVEDVFK